jgi:UDP-glucose 4-epimerase
MEVLITGGLGFIGSNLAEYYVNNGDNVTILSRSDTKHYNIRPFKDKVSFIQKDIREISEEDVIDKDVIFHCASTVDNYNILSDPYLDININCIGTIALLEACRKVNKDAKIVYTSTFFVNGNPPNLPVTTDMKPEPLGVYGASKLAAEHILKTYQKVFGLKPIIARLSNVFGLKEQDNNNKKAAFNRMIYMAVHNETIKLYDNGKIIRDYIYIDDVVSALDTLYKKGEVGKVYYVGTGKGHTFREMVDIILEEANWGNVEVVPPPAFHSNVGIDDFICDVQDLKDLGWKQKVSLRDGIRKVVTQYKLEYPYTGYGE